MLIVLLLLQGATAEGEPALARLARAVVEQSQRAALEAPVAVHVEAPTPALARAFGSLLAAQLAARKLSGTVLEAPNPTAAEKLAREKDLRGLVRVALTSERGQIIARGDALHTWVNFWAGAAPTRAGSAAAIAATVDADLQATTLAATAVPQSAPLNLSVGALSRLAAPPAALAIGDLDGDGRPEIGILTDDEVLVLSADGRAVVARYDLRGLPASARPTREPFGALALAPGRLSWISGRRAHGETLSFAAGALKPITTADGLSIDGVGVRLMPGLNAFEPAVTWLGKPATLPEPLTMASARAGSALLLYANGTGAAGRSGPPTAVFSGAPSAAVLADLDADGTVEVLATSARFFPDGDALKVLPIAAVEAIGARAGPLSDAASSWSGATPRGRVLSIAAGDLDGDGADEVVLGSWLADGTGELLLVRRAAP